MALVATKLFPPSPESVPLGGGLFLEIWQLTGDGADTTVDITTHSIKRIKGATAGMSTNNVTVNTADTITLTFATAPGNGLTLQAFVVGKA